MVLKHRIFEPHELGIFEINATAHEMLYRSSGRTDSEPLAAIANVLVPNNPDKGKVVIHVPPEDSASNKCSPSETLKKGNFHVKEDQFARQDILLVNTYLQQGWIVIIPDYEGPHSAFGVTALSGHIVLDSARASRNLRELGLNDDVKFVMIGYSGGASSSAWAVQLHESYAPDINLVGSTFGGTPVNLIEHMVVNDKTKHTPTFMNTMGGIINGNPDKEHEILQYFNRDGLEGLHWVRTHCPGQSSEKDNVNIRRPSTAFLKGGKNFTQVPLIMELLGQSTLPQKNLDAPRIPIFMFHAKSDTTIKLKPAKEAAEQWCKNGANIHFQTQTFPVSHKAAYIATYADTMAFIKDRFDGKEYYGGKCHFDSVATPAFNIRRDIQLAGQMIDTAKTLFGSLTHSN